MSTDHRIHELEMRLARLVQANLALFGVVDELLTQSEARPGVLGSALDPPRSVALQENLATVREVLMELADTSPEPA